jgi:hypothetical protein
MYLPNGYNFKYEDVGFRNWPPKLGLVTFKLDGGYLPTL